MDNKMGNNANKARQMLLIECVFLFDCCIGSL